MSDSKVRILLIFTRQLGRREILAKCWYRTRSLTYVQDNTTKLVAVEL